jgi:hypothetical protein
MSELQPENNERLTKVETQVVGITQDLAGIWKILRDIQDSINKSQKTDWQTILIGLTVIGALYASAIHPIQSDIERTSADAKALAQAVIVQNDRIAAEKIDRLAWESDIKVRIAINEFQLQWQREHKKTNQ